MNEQQQRLFQAAQDARVALNECVKVFVGLAHQGRYPEALIGRGWKFVTDARDALIPAVQPFMPADDPDDWAADPSQAGEFVISDDNREI